VQEFDNGCQRITGCFDHPLSRVDELLFHVHELLNEFMILVLIAITTLHDLLTSLPGFLIT
jgi:hypothetical protein